MPVAKILISFQLFSRGEKNREGYSATNYMAMLATIEGKIDKWLSNGQVKNGSLYFEKTDNLGSRSF